MKEDKFSKELEQLINKYSKENDSNTPDFILASYINDCLLAFSNAVSNRDGWYGFKPFSDGVTLEPTKSNIGDSDDSISPNTEQ